MKKIHFIGILFLIIASLPIFSFEKPENEIQKANESFKRLMLNAQPLPVYNNDEFYYKVPLVPIDAAVSSVFLNANLSKVGWTGSEQMQNESSIAVNFTDNLNLISSAVDYRDNGATWVYVSKDGGRSWVNKNLGRPFVSWRASNDPSVAFANDGTGYLVYGGFPNMQSSGGITFGENGVFLSKTTDKGLTWKAHIPVILHKGTMTIDSTFEDKYYIQVDNSQESPYKDHLYIPWKRVTPRDSATQIVIAKSTDKGETWSNPVNVSKRLSGSSEDTTFGQSFPLCITGTKGQVYVVWNHGIEHGVGFAKSLDGGKTFSEAKIIQKYNIFGITTLIKDQGYRHTVKGKVRAESYPTMVCDISNSSRRGNLYLVWAADNIPNIYFSSSSDEGNTWSKPKIIHSDTTNDQFWPWIALDRTNGEISVMYLDSRLDKNNILTDCFVSYSKDGGETWIDRRASDVSSDLRNNPFSYQAFAGDYSGCAFHDGIIYPSWVDMRAAQKNTFDNDVYTALININKPMPVDTLIAEINPNAISEVILKWKYDKPTKAFGQPILSNKDYLFKIYRNGTFLNLANGNIFEYKDVNLTPHSKYTYSIIVVTQQDSSIDKIVDAFPGGSKLPGNPVIISANGNDTNNVRLFIKIPSKRSDEITPLSNLSNIKIFRDSVFLKNVKLNLSDTGKILTIEDTPKDRGFYSYYTAIEDNETTPNLSNFSNEITLYTGIVEDNFSDNFDEAKQNKYLNINKWGIVDNFSNSAPNSITESPVDKYQTNKNYILGIIPVLHKTNVQITFNHVAVLHQSDSAIVEYSVNSSKNWTKLSSYNKNSYPGWADGSLIKDDWKKETFNVKSAMNDTIFFRFRLFSNIISVDDGWYIDDIAIKNTIVSVEENNEENIEVYPNPFSRLLTIYPGKSTIKSLEIFDIYGQKLFSGNNIETADKLFVNTDQFTAGIYILKVETGNKFYFKKLIKE
jgi:hypothetical protein